LVLGRQRLNDFPCPVRASIVNEYEVAVGRNFFLRPQVVEHRERSMRSLAKDVLLVVAGNDDRQKVHGLSLCHPCCTRRAANVHTRFSAKLDMSVPSVASTWA